MKDMIVHAFQEAHENFARMLAEFLPRFLVMLIIIALGALIAYMLRYVVRAILRITQLDRVSDQAGASRLLRKADLPTMTELLSRAIFWVVWLAFIMIGVSVLGIVSLQQQIASLIGLLPQIFVALLILFVGMLAANFFSRAALLAGVNAGLPSPRFLSETVRFVIALCIISMALEQIGLGRQTILVAFALVFGALMMGLAIAFGLGGRHLARRVLEKHFLHNEKESEDELSPL